MMLKQLAPLMMLPLAACGLWVNYTQPETPAPQAFQEAPKDAAAQWPDNQWWQQFNAPELTAMMQEAEAVNYDIKAAVARVKQADAQVRIAGAALLPTVEGTAGISRSQRSLSKGGTTITSTTTPVTTSGTSRTSNAMNLGANASYELDFWGKNSASTESAEAAADASRYDAQTVRMTVQASVANTYFDALATKARLKTAQDNYQNANDLLKAIKLRFDQGIATELDVVQQENVVATQNVAVAPLQLQLRKDLDALAILLGKLPEQVAVPEGDLLTITTPPVIAGLPSELLLRRPDVQNAEAQLIAADANIVNARAQFFPSVVLTGQAGYQSDALRTLVRPDSMLWSIGSSMTQTIFDGGALFGNLELRHAQYDELLQNYQKVVLSSFSDVEDSLATVTQTAAEERDQQSAAKSARRAYALSQQQFQGGITDITTVLNTQRTLFSAEDQYLALRLAHLQGMVALYNSLGGGWQKPGDAPAAKP